MSTRLDEVSQAGTVKSRREMAGADTTARVPPGALRTAFTKD